jgi:hypothetical protein
VYLWRYWRLFFPVARKNEYVLLQQKVSDVLLYSRATQGTRHVAGFDTTQEEEARQLPAWSTPASLQATTWEAYVLQHD